MGKLFTIGHSNHRIDTFIGLLDKYQITDLLDVRSVPYSKYAECFNRENLSRSLGKSGIRYFFMGNYFGARPKDSSLYDGQGCLDFSKVMESPVFQKGMDNVILGLGQGYRIVLMCTEKSPVDCHRAILVGRAFSLRDWNAEHILPDGSILTQQELDRILMQRYFPDRGQLTLFHAEMEPTEEEYIREAYQLRNKEIGYRIDPFHIRNGERCIVYTKSEY